MEPENDEDKLTLALTGADPGALYDLLLNHDFADDDEDDEDWNLDFDDEDGEDVLSCASEHSNVFASDLDSPEPTPKRSKQSTGEGGAPSSSSSTSSSISSSDIYSSSKTGNISTSRETSRIRPKATSVIDRKDSVENENRKGESSRRKNEVGTSTTMTTSDLESHETRKHQHGGNTSDSDDYSDDSLSYSSSDDDGDDNDEDHDSAGRQEEASTKRRRRSRKDRTRDRHGRDDSPFWLRREAQLLLSDWNEDVECPDGSDRQGRTRSGWTAKGLGFGDGGSSYTSSASSSRMRSNASWNQTAKLPPGGPNKVGGLSTMDEAHDTIKIAGLTGEQLALPSVRAVIKRQIQQYTQLLSQQVLWTAEEERQKPELAKDTKQSRHREMLFQLIRDVEHRRDHADQKRKLIAMQFPRHKVPVSHTIANADAASSSCTSITPAPKPTPFAPIGTSSCASVGMESSSTIAGSYASSDRTLSPLRRVTRSIVATMQVDGAAESVLHCANLIDPKELTAAGTNYERKAKDNRVEAAVQFATCSAHVRRRLRDLFAKAKPNQKLWNELLPPTGMQDLCCERMATPMKSHSTASGFKLRLAGKYLPSEGRLLTRAVREYGYEESPWEDIKRSHLPTKSAESIQEHFKELTRRQTNDNDLNRYYQWAKSWLEYRKALDTFWTIDQDKKLMEGVLNSSEGTAKWRKIKERYPILKHRKGRDLQKRWDFIHMMAKSEKKIDYKGPQPPEEEVPPMFAKKRRRNHSSRKRNNRGVEVLDRSAPATTEDASRDVTQKSGRAAVNPPSAGTVKVQSVVPDAASSVKKTDRTLPLRSPSSYFALSPGISNIAVVSGAPVPGTFVQESLSTSQYDGNQSAEKSSDAAPAVEQRYEKEQLQQHKRHQHQRRRRRQPPASKQKVVSEDSKAPEYTTFSLEIPKHDLNANKISNGSPIKQRRTPFTLSTRESPVLGSSTSQNYMTENSLWAGLSIGSPNAARKAADTTLSFSPENLRSGRDAEGRKLPQETLDALNNEYTLPVLGDDYMGMGIGSSMQIGDQEQSMIRLLSSMAENSRSLDGSADSNSAKRDTTAQKSSGTIRIFEGIERVRASEDATVSNVRSRVDIRDLVDPRSEQHAQLMEI